MATYINSSRSCLPPFYTIPIFPLLIDFYLLVSFLFFAALCILSSEEYNSLRLFIVVYTLVVFMSCWPVLFILKRDCLRLFVVVYKLVTLMLCCW